MAPLKGIASAVLSLLSGCSWGWESRPLYAGDAPRHAKREIYKRVAGRELAIYLYLPKDWQESDRRPAIVFYSGGGWQWSGPSQFIRHCEYLSSRGMVAAAAQFRAGSAPPYTPAWAVEDAKSTVRWLRKNAERLGVDPERIVTSGFSSGGHMAAATAMLEGFETPGEDLSVSSKPNAMVLVNPPMGFSKDISKHVGRTKLSPEEWRALEPNGGLRKGLPPAFIVYGTKDWLLPGGETFIEESRRLGNVLDVMMVEGEEHGFAKAPPWHERVLERVDRFLASVGYLEGEPTIETPEGWAKPEVRRPVVVSPGTILESWEEGEEMSWAPWDDTVVLDAVRKAKHGKWGARLKFDFTQYEFPVMYCPLDEPWDLDGTEKLVVDVFVPSNLAGRLALTVQLGGKRQAAPSWTLGRGWNEVQLDLAGNWLTPEVRARVDRIAFLLSTEEPGIAGALVFDSLRAE